MKKGYMKDTTAYEIRIERELLKRFKDAFVKEKERLRKTTGQILYVKTLCAEWMENFIKQTGDNRDENEKISN